MCVCVSICSALLLKLQNTHRSLPTQCDYQLIWGAGNQIKGDRKGGDNVVNGSKHTPVHTHTHTHKIKEQQIGVQISEDFNLPMGQPLSISGPKTRKSLSSLGTEVTRGAVSLPICFFLAPSFRRRDPTPLSFLGNLTPPSPPLPSLPSSAHLSELTFLPPSHAEQTSETLKNIHPRKR